MPLFITIITGDFGDISGFLPLFLSLATCGCSWSGISSSCSGVRPFAPSLTAFLLFLFLGFLKGLLGLGALFNWVGLILGLWGLLISLIVPRIETHLQELFLLRALLI